MAYNLSDRVFRQLKKVRGYAILYAHFGRNQECQQVICEDAQTSLRALEREYRKGEIYVTTTSKLLNYYINHKYLNASSRKTGNQFNIDIHGVDDPVFGTFVPTVQDLQGITFYVPSGNDVRMFIDGKEVKTLIRNPADERHKESVSIPLRSLQYPESESAR
jgi:hypothetical protein